MTRTLNLLSLAMAATISLGIVLVGGTPIGAAALLALCAAGWLFRRLYRAGARALYRRRFPQSAFPQLDARLCAEERQARWQNFRWDAQRAAPGLILAAAAFGHQPMRAAQQPGPAYFDLAEAVPPAERALVPAASEAVAKSDPNLSAQWAGCVAAQRPCDYVRRGYKHPGRSNCART
ncbi:MAG TPA: hypothetical protein VNV39_19185 [Stellaceae bacterium]|jgi:hypothetical protein|nr:hypothetical protein [Stellaceae bacterium]